jgi:hypothetical protein
MGKYINNINGKHLPATEKTEFILENVKGSMVIPRPAQWKEDIVCVVSNGYFEAAAYAFDAQELEEFKYPEDTRSKVWLYVPNAAQFIDNF